MINTTTKSATAIVYFNYVFAVVMLFVTFSLLKAIGAFLLSSFASLILHNTVLGMPLFHADEEERNS